MSECDEPSDRAAKKPNKIKGVANFILANSNEQLELDKLALLLDVDVDVFVFYRHDLNIGSKLKLAIRLSSSMEQLRARTGMPLRQMGS